MERESLAGMGIGLGLWHHSHDDDYSPPLTNQDLKLLDLEEFTNHNTLNSQNSPTIHSCLYTEFEFNDLFSWKDGSDSDTVLNKERPLEITIKKRSKPRKKISAYNLFIQEKVAPVLTQFSKSNYSNLKGEQTKERMDSIASQWKAMSATERSVYELAAQKGSLTFEPEKQEYDKVASSKKPSQLAFEKLKPKMPMGPFTHFSVEERKKDPELYKKLGLEKATKVLSEKWRNLEPSIKEVYMQAYSQAKISYKKAMEAYKIKVLKGEKLVKPKRELYQPFVFFVKASYHSLKQSQSSLSHLEIMRKLSQIWFSLSPEQKAKYGYSGDTSKRDSILSTLQ